MPSLEFANRLTFGGNGARIMSAAQSIGVNGDTVKEVKIETPEVVVSPSEVSKRFSESKGRAPKRKLEADPDEPARKSTKYKTVSSFGGRSVKAEAADDTLPAVKEEESDAAADSKNTDMSTSSITKEDDNRTQADNEAQASSQTELSDTVQTVSERDNVTSIPSRNVPASSKEEVNINMEEKSPTAADDKASNEIKSNLKVTEVDEDVKVCDICGDAGFEEMLAVCTKCNEGAEHIYCMETLLEELPEGDWFCYGCRRGKARKTEKVVSSVTRERKIKSGIRFPTRSKDVLPTKGSIGSRLKNRRPEGSSHLPKKLEDELKSPVAAQEDKVPEPAAHNSRRQPGLRMDAGTGGLDTGPISRPLSSKDGLVKSADPGRAKVSGATTIAVGASRVGQVKGRSTANDAEAASTRPPRAGIPRPVSSSRGPFSFLLDSKQGSVKKGLKPANDGKEGGRVFPTKGPRPDTPRPGHPPNQWNAAEVESPIDAKSAASEGPETTFPKAGRAAEEKSPVNATNGGSNENTEGVLIESLPNLVKQHGPFVQSSEAKRVFVDIEKDKGKHTQAQLTPMSKGYSSRSVLGQVLDLPQMLEKPGLSDASVAEALPAIMPSADISWRGHFEVTASGSTAVYDSFQARASNHASPKVLDATKLLPQALIFQEYQRLTSWPKRFSVTPPTDRDIALYFFPVEEESCGKQYTELLERMVNFDLVLKCSLGGAELLVIPSNMLSESFQHWRSRKFLWGVFQGKKSSLSRTASLQPEITPKLAASLPIPLLEKANVANLDQQPMARSIDDKGTQPEEASTKATIDAPLDQAVDVVESERTTDAACMKETTKANDNDDDRSVRMPPGFEHYAKQYSKFEESNEEQVQELKASRDDGLMEESNQRAATGTKRDGSKEEKEDNKIRLAKDKKSDQERDRDRDRERKEKHDRDRERRERDREKKDRERERERRDRDRVREIEKDRAQRDAKEKRDSRYAEKGRRRHRSRSRSYSPPLRKKHRSPSLSPPRKRTMSRSPRRNSRSRSPGFTSTRHRSKSSTESLDSQDDRARKKARIDTTEADTGSKMTKYHNFLLEDETERRSMEQELFPVSERAVTSRAKLDLMQIPTCDDHEDVGLDLELSPAAEAGPLPLFNDRPESPVQLWPSSSSTPRSKPAPPRVEEHTPLTLSLAVPQYRKTGNSWVKVGEDDNAQLGAEDVHFALAL